MKWLTHRFVVPTCVGSIPIYRPDVMFNKLPLWRNRQTRWTQNPVPARECGFDPHRRHRKSSGFQAGLRSYLIIIMPLWRNRQTRWTQNPVPARECGFDPHRRHNLKTFGLQVRRSRNRTSFLLHLTFR